MVEVYPLANSSDIRRDDSFDEVADVAQVSSIVRLRAARIHCLVLAEAYSIGLRSGE
jgi:hypothetical protein